MNTFGRTCFHAANCKRWIKTPALKNSAEFPTLIAIGRGSQSKCNAGTGHHHHIQSRFVYGSLSLYGRAHEKAIFRGRPARGTNISRHGAYFVNTSSDMQCTCTCTGTSCFLHFRGCNHKSRCYELLLRKDKVLIHICMHPALRLYKNQLAMSTTCTNIKFNV